MMLAKCHAENSIAYIQRTGDYQGEEQCVGTGYVKIHPH